MDVNQYVQRSTQQMQQPATELESGILEPLQLGVESASAQKMLLAMQNPLSDDDDEEMEEYSQEETDQMSN